MKLLSISIGKGNDTKLDLKYEFIDYIFNVIVKKIMDKYGIKIKKYDVYQIQHYFVTQEKNRLNGHRDTWRIGRRSFSVLTLQNESRLTFTGRN